MPVVAKRSLPVSRTANSKESAAAAAAEQGPEKDLLSPIIPDYLGAPSRVGRKHVEKATPSPSSPLSSLSLGHGGLPFSWALTVTLLSPS